MNTETSVSAPSISPETRLKPAWLLPMRLLWLVLTGIAISLFFIGLPIRAQGVYNTYRGFNYASLSQITLLPNKTGQVILSQWYRSTATQAGLLEGDILLSINDIPVTSVDQADALLKDAANRPAILRVQTGDFPARQVSIGADDKVGALLLRLGFSNQFAIIFVLASEVIFTMICLMVAFVIFWYRSDDWMALMASLVLTMCLVGLSTPVISFGQTLRSFRFPPLLDVWFLFSFSLLLVFFYLFPSGRFLSLLTKILTAALLLWNIVALFDYHWYVWYLPNQVVYAALVAGWILSGIISLTYRYLRHSDAQQRKYLRWVILGIIASVVGIFLQVVSGAFNWWGSSGIPYDFIIYPLGQLLKLTMPLAISFAVLRYRMWDIQIIINRSLVYGTLTLSIILLYVLSVGGLSILFQGQNSTLVSFSSMGLVALVVQPLQVRLQRSVNRMMYGERDDPYAVLSRLSGALETTADVQEVLPAIAETIGYTLKIPYVVILLEQNGETQQVAAYGTAQENLLTFPLVYQGENIGSLQLAQRAPGENFSRNDRRLIENIARQAGASAQAVRLNAQLIRSRTQIVNEREEERLRIRRDLHDELGPILASQGLKLAAARQLVHTNADKAEALIDDIIKQSQKTVTDIRRLVHGLRPPALDQLGLVEAIRDLVRNSDDLNVSGLKIELSTPGGELPSMPPAVEVNAYRIVLEALSNVSRHAQAQRCTATFEIAQNALLICIRDDGVGLPKNYRAGVGLRSMRERAEEIGGSLRVENIPSGGTQTTVRLPLSC